MPPEGNIHLLRVKKRSGQCKIFGSFTEWNTWRFVMIAKEQCEYFYSVVKPNFWEPPCWACRTRSSLRSASNLCSSPGAAAVSTSPSSQPCLHTTPDHQTYLTHAAILCFYSAKSILGSFNFLLMLEKWILMELSGWVITFGPGFSPGMLSVNAVWRWSAYHPTGSWLSVDSLSIDEHLLIQNTTGLEALLF